MKMKLVFTVLLSCVTIISAFGQFKLDSIIEESVSSDTRLKTTFIYNDNGNATYIESHEFQTFEIKYDAEQRVEKVITRDYATKNLVQTEIVVRDMEGKYDSINYFDGTGFMHTSNIFSYEDDKVSEIRSHHFYDDTLNTEDHTTFEYNNKGLLETQTTKFGEIFVAKSYMFYDKMERLKKVYGKFGDYDFNYKGEELLGFTINETFKYKVIRNPDISQDMYMKPKAFYDYIYSFDTFAFGSVMFKLVFAGRQPSKIVLEDESIIISYYYSALVPNNNTQIHGQWIEVYPNPMTDILQLGNGLELETLRIYNMTGQLVEEFKGDLTTISIGHLPSEMYLVSAIDKEGNSYVSKVVKSK